MEYDDILKKLFLPQNEILIPDGIAYSEAVCEEINGKFADSFFLYTITDEGKEAIGPISKISLDFVSNEVIGYYEYDNYKKFSIKNSYEIETIIKALENYEKIYPIFREIYMRGFCYDEERELLLRLMKCFKVFANSEILDIYYQLFPNSFKFIMDNTD